MGELSIGDDERGDAACWLDQVCDVCGGFVEAGREHECRQPASGPSTASAPAGRQSPDAS